LKLFQLIISHLGRPGFFTVKSEKFNCPCCKYKTLEEKSTGTYYICAVCFWEDDAVQFYDPNYIGGANKFSLKQSQKNFKKFGAVERRLIKFVRKVRSDEE